MPFAAPTLHNIYISDFSSTSCKRYIYADDVTLTCSDKPKDLDCISIYYLKWLLKLTTAKSVSSIFHLRNHLAQNQLQVHLRGNSIPFDPTPRYLGVTLDWSLTFHQHIEKLKNTMTSRVAFLK